MSYLSSLATSAAASRGTNLFHRSDRQALYGVRRLGAGVTTGDNGSGSRREIVFAWDEAGGSSPVVTPAHREIRVIPPPGYTRINGLPPRCVGGAQYLQRRTPGRRTPVRRDSPPHAANQPTIANTTTDPKVTERSTACWSIASQRRRRRRCCMRRHRSRGPCSPSGQSRRSPGAAGNHHDRRDRHARVTVRLGRERVADGTSG